MKVFFEIEVCPLNLIYFRYIKLLIYMVNASDYRGTFLLATSQSKPKKSEQVQQV